jgi:hypothetical protein
MISFNTNGAKRNLNFIYYDIIYICETWLLDFECKFLLENLSYQFITVHHSDMLIYPYGGRAFMINKKIKIINFEFTNKHVSYILFSINNIKFCNIYSYLPYDDNKQLTLSEFSSCLLIIGELFNCYNLKNFQVSIMDYFNADVLRFKRFDLIFKQFIFDYNLNIISPSLDPSLFTYSKGDYSAFIDHCLINNLNFDNYKCNLIESDINLSDHKPLLLSVEWSSYACTNVNEIAFTEPLNNLMIKLNPNLDNIEIYQKFNNILNENISNFINMPIIYQDDHQKIINDMYLQLTTSIKSAFGSCSRTVSFNIIKKKKNWLTDELKKIKNEIIELRFSAICTAPVLVEIKQLKKKFKKIMKKNIYLYEKMNFIKLIK